MDFETNRVENKKFKAKIVRENMLISKKDTEVIVSYYDYHFGHHMWKDIERNYLVYYESEIKLVEEIQQKVA